MKLLWVKSNLLHPLDSGGTIRTYNMLKHLRQEHHVTFVALKSSEDGRSHEKAGEYCDRLVEVPWQGAPPRSDPRFYFQALANLASNWPLPLERYRVPALDEKLVEVTTKETFDVAICDFLFSAPSFRNLDHLPTVLFQHNVETLIWERMAEASRLLGPYYRAQAQRMEDWEGRLARRFDLVVAVSEEDADIFRNRFELPRVASVPTGVDVEYFQPANGTAAGDNRVVFVGSLDWLPNVDAVEWLLDEIWPAVGRRRSDARLHLVGRNPARRVRHAARENNRVHLFPDVPDVRPYLHDADVVVVPLRVGGGTRLKIFEALAAGKAVVTTSVGAEGLPVEHGEHLFVANDTKDFADRIIQLLEAPDRRSDLGRRGRRLVEERFSWQRAAERFANLCTRAIRFTEEARKV